MKRRAKVIKFPRVPIRCDDDGRGRGGESATIIILPVVRIEQYGVATPPRPNKGDAA